MKTMVKTTGFRELEAALKQLPRATAKTVVRRTLMKAGAPILAAAADAAPLRRGRLKTGIAQSGKAKGGNAGARAFGAALRAGLDKGAAREAARAANSAASGSMEMYIGPDQSDGQGLLQEFGTATNPAQPFLRPAWDGNKDLALQIIKQTLQSEILRAMTRLGKKQAKAGL